MFLRPLCQERSISATISPEPQSLKQTGKKAVRKRTNLEVVLVRQRILNSLKQRRNSKNLLAHLVHGSLNTGADILSESLEGNLARSLIGSIELANVGRDLRHIGELAPLPVGSNISAENPVPGLLESSVLITEETPELGTGALQHGQALDRGVNGNTLALDNIDLHISGLGAGLDERVGVWLAVDVHALPAVGDDVDVCGVDVVVLLDEMCAEDGAEQFGGCDGVLAGCDVDGVLDRVGCDDHAVIGLSVAAEMG